MLTSTLGLPDSEEGRFEPFRWAADPSWPWVDPASHVGLAANAAVGDVLDLPNIREVRAAGLSSAAGVASAEGMARIYAAALTGLEGEPAIPPLLTEETIRSVSAEQVFGIDRVFGETGCFGTVFMKSHTRMPFGSYRAFGHDGASASLGFADPVYELGFGYVPQTAEPGGVGCRNFQLSSAVQGSDCWLRGLASAELLSCAAELLSWAELLAEAARPGLRRPFPPIRCRW